MCLFRISLEVKKSYLIFLFVSMHNYESEWCFQACSRISSVILLLLVGPVAEGSYLGDDGFNMPSGDLALISADSDRPLGVRGSTEANVARRMRIAHPERLPKRTVINMVAGVGAFERWLWETSATDRRCIVDIPPRELDSYLSDFFSTVKTPSGQNYKLESFQALKVSIFRYLKEANYPECPKTSSTFVGCFSAYRHRRNQLREETLAPK